MQGTEKKHRRSAVLFVGTGIARPCMGAKNYGSWDSRRMLRILLAVSSRRFGQPPFRLRRNRANLRYVFLDWCEKLRLVGL